MGQPYVSGFAGSNCSISGPVKMADLHASMTYGKEFEETNLFAYTKASAGAQFLGNSATDKNFSTKLYPTFGAGVGYNRTGKGLFGSIEQGYKVGVDRTTKVLSQVGKVSEAQIGIRDLTTRTPYNPSLSREVGLFGRSESYSLRGHNLDFDYKRAGAFVSADVVQNLNVTLSAGLEQHPHLGKAIKPALGATVAYHF